MQRAATEEAVRYTRYLLSRLGYQACAIIFLCEHLNSLEFYYLIPDDSNRASDALAIRNEYELAYGTDELYGVIGTPTVLEALVSMAERATIMDFDPPVKWFELFIDNLGLSTFVDSNWNENSERYVTDVIRIWLDRKFESNGVGSPFRGNGRYDVSKTSMWDALQWYLSNSFGGAT